jgi:hypothetical protein
MLRMSNNPETNRMKGHSIPRGRTGAVVALAVLLIAGHGVILYYASSHLALSAGLVSGVILLIVIKHLGLFGPVYALFRRCWLKR